MTPAATIMARFGLRDPALVDHGKIATAWKVMRGKQPVALKIYHGGNTQDEWPGVRYIQSCAGAGAVQIYDHADGALVMEWLGGPSLGDLARQGDDASASAQLGATALQLHKAARARDLPSLQARMQALLTYEPQHSWPKATQASIRAAQNLAKRLIDNQRDISPLHGDLHHDNIRRSARGYLAFDAKGLIGDPAYDLANAFLNPMGSPDIVADQARVQQMAAIFADTTQMPAARLLDWTIAHCALTLAWEDAALPDVTMLDLLMRARSVCGDSNLGIAEFNL